MSRDDGRSDNKILRDLRILGVKGDGRTITVGVYGGATNACGFVKFEHEDLAAYVRDLVTLSNWFADDAAVKYVDGDRISLELDDGEAEA